MTVGDTGFAVASLLPCLEGSMQHFNRSAELSRTAMEDTRSRRDPLAVFDWHIPAHDDTALQTRMPNGQHRLTGKLKTELQQLV